LITCKAIINSFSIPSISSDPQQTTFPDGITPITKPFSSNKTHKEVLEEISTLLANNDKVDALKNLGSLYDAELQEFNDSPEEILGKVKQIAEVIRAAKHVVVYTGAGVSTSAKIPDYRGPQGVWTLSRIGGPRNTMNLSQALPTYSHYALTELYRKDVIKYVVSTNLDGLHRRSGIPADGISELHGNCYREVCATCGKEYLRAFDVLPSRSDRWTHLTHRNCSCGGPLKDTIVHFTESIYKFIA
jgi:hypothetical protein